MTRSKLSGKFWLALTTFSLIGQVAWIVENMYLNVFIYKMFNASAADISAMVTASSIAATLTTVFIGALSDKLGKRKVFMCTGYILWGISIFSFVALNTKTLGTLFPMAVSVTSLGVTLTILLDCVMTFFGSAANDAAFNAWLTDSTDSTNRGAAEGINSMMPLVSMLLVFGGFMFFDLNKAQSWTVIFTVIGVIVTVIGVLGFFIIKDSAVAPSDSGYFSNVVHGFLPSTVKQNKSFYKTLLCYVIFCISIQVFMPYLILYYEVSLGITNYVPILAPAVILAAVATFFWGKVYDKKGFDLSSGISILSLVLGYVFLFLFKNIVMVFIGSLLMMCGYLCSTAVFGAKIRDLTPVGMAGRFQGVRIFSQVLVPGIVGPFIGKTILQDARTIVNNDGTTSFVPNENIFLGALAVLVILIVLMLITRDKKQYRTRELSTDFESDNSSSWQTEHPRPQMMRKDVLNLCGSWQLSSLYKGKLTELGDITVPFPPESALSGIKRQKKDKEKYVYEKTFTIPEQFHGKRLILHFDAVDNTAELYLNGEYLATHHGGYTPFDFHITNKVKDGENTVKVIVTDELDRDYPYGKQSKKRGGMWYTPISGIWQAVWLEAVPYQFVSEIKTDVTLDSVTFSLLGGNKHKIISIDGVGEYEFDGDTFTLSVPDPKLWSPEAPHLYYYTLTCGEDVISSYFALRTVDIREVNVKSFICLNGKPYFFHGLLDQGYWPDGIFTPATPKGYEYDILQMKKLGFNMLRKHIKSEPEAFYYYCDKHGMVVFQDFINSGKYSFLLDTALPTVGIKKGLTRPASKKRKEVFYENAIALISRLHSHPSVCYYTIFNEGWGQHDHDAIYRRLKDLQPSVVFDTASGWFIPKESDVTSDHVYFKKINSKAKNGKPLVLSEFGGYSYKIPQHSFNLDKTFGYKKCPDREDFNSSLEALYINEVLPTITSQGLNAAVLTQVSDVEDETNGLLTYDRKITKADEPLMQSIAKRLFDEFDNVTSK